MEPLIIFYKKYFIFCNDSLQRRKVKDFYQSKFSSFQYQLRKINWCEEKCSQQGGRRVTKFTLIKPQSEPRPASRIFQFWANELYKTLDISDQTNWSQPEFKLSLKFVYIFLHERIKFRVANFLNMDFLAENLFLLNNNLFFPDKT